MAAPTLNDFIVVLCSVDKMRRETKGKSKRWKSERVQQEKGGMEGGEMQE